jgi:hypothetical protein
MKKINWIIIAVLGLIFTSCEKNEENLDFISSQQNVIKAGGPKSTTPSLPNLWGIGADSRVYRYNGNTWYEPNSGAGLYQISAGHDGGTWGIGANGRIFKYNGSNWFEPNASASLNKISAVSEMVAWGIGASGRVFYTNNGGTNWSEPNPNIHLKEISIGGNIWGISLSNNIGQIINNTWVPIVTTYQFKQISASDLNNCLWGIGYDNQVYKSHWVQPVIGNGYYDPRSFDRVNTSGIFSQVSIGPWESIGNTTLRETDWVIGDSYRLFKSTNGGLNWVEPNPGSGLAQISVGGN